MKRVQELREKYLAPVILSAEERKKLLPDIATNAQTENFRGYTFDSPRMADTGNRNNRHITLYVLNARRRSYLACGWLL